MKNYTPRVRRGLYASVCGKKWPDSIPWVGSDDRLYGMWILGQDYRNRTPYYGCLDPSTKVLTADLRWVRNGDLNVGDELVGVEEFGCKKKLIRTKVEKIGPVRLRSCVLSLSNGTEITCSLNHMWLSKEKHNGKSKWKTARQLQIGDVIRRACPTWGPNKMTTDRAWLSGLIDGEGSCDSALGFRVAIYQNKGAVLDRARNILQAYNVGFSESLKSSSDKCVQLRTTTSDESLRLLGLTRPTRFDGCWEGVGMGIKDGFVTVVGKRNVGKRDLIGMETSSKTFIAEGLVSHNSYPPNFLERVFSLFPDAGDEETLHLFSGSLPKGTPGRRVDINRKLKPDIVWDAHKLSSCPALKKGVKLIVADPPYSTEDATRYGTAMIKRKVVLEECAKILQPGGWIVWLDQAMPMFSKLRLSVRLAGAIGIIRSTNHRFRVVTLFQKMPQTEIHIKRIIR